MISSDVDVAPRSLADQLSDFSQRFDHENDGHGEQPSHETSSQKIGKGSKKLTPAAFRSTKLRYGGGDSRTDVNSVAITAKHSQSYRNTNNVNNPTPYSKTLAMKQAELASTAKRPSRDYRQAQQYGPGESQYDNTRNVNQQMSKTRFEINDQYNNAKDCSRAQQPALASRAEIDLQVRDLEYKIGAADRKNQESFNELRDQGQDLANKLADEKISGEDNDQQLLSEVQAFETQVEGRLLKQKHVSINNNVL